MGEWRYSSTTSTLDGKTVGLEVLTAVTIKNTVFWLVTPCSSETTPRF
jgi:predicted lipoprotein